MVGRKPSVSKKDVDQVFQVELNNIVRDNKVVQPTDPIWATIQVTYGWKEMNPKAIYERARKWKLKVDLDQQDGAGRNDAASDVSEQSVSINLSDLPENDTISSNEVSVKSAEKLRFKISLTNDVWQTISPIDVSYKRALERFRKKNIRGFKILQPGVWTNVITDHIIKNPTVKRLNCCWTFKRAKVYPLGNCYVKMFGGCNACAAKLTGVIFKEPQPNEVVTISFTARNISNHFKHPKRALSGRKAKELFSSSKSAGNVRRKMVDESMDMFEREPITIPTSNAIRCGQYRHRKQEKLAGEPFLALYYLKASPSYSGSITMLGYDPFCVHYTTQNQFRMFNAYKQRNSRTKLCCDATGGVVHNIRKGHSPHLINSNRMFVYSIFSFPETLLAREISYSYSIKNVK